MFHYYYSLLMFLFLSIILLHDSLMVSCRILSCHTFKNYTANMSQTIRTNMPNSFSNVISRTFLKSINSQLIFGRSILIDNSKNILEVLQPNNDNEGCKKRLLALPSNTGDIAKNCQLVLNAGLFDTKTNECYGNIINRGIVYKNSGGIKNANFGIKKDGSLFFGYISEDEVLSGQFQSLVSGAIWLLQDGVNVVDRSISEECPDVQETGSLRTFANVLSARSTIGAFANGTVVIVQVSGRTNQGGVNLFDLAQLLIEMGVVAAVNLDGGGSSTVVINRTVVSYPSDVCGPFFTCERNVTTVLCVRAHCPRPCPPLHTCIYGFCEPSTDLKSNVTIALLVAFIVDCFLILALIVTLVNVRRKRYVTRSPRFETMEIEANEPLLPDDIDT